MNTSRGSGGTAILIRKSSGFKIKPVEFQNDRICGVILSTDGFQDICVICTLLPSTNYSQDVYLDYLDVLSCYYGRMREDYITIIGGDFNVDISCENVSTKSNALKCFLDSRNIKVAHLLNDVTGPNYTFRNKDKSQKSLIDYICIPEILENDISNLGV
ncbi:unnamed protein product [Mytilus coruscus]|uniref:Endonuclease/exonuclease/phosphatase domain-containing protein n=1 Tax=Mytilus coruscus TaxID=42192 RepID=A0A6J8DBU7_MYTCO|nr:unnamed protein product [Mytilus coruscus]